MLPPELFNFDPKDHPLILDMAASPGGKDHPPGFRTGDTGLVITNNKQVRTSPACGRFCKPGIGKYRYHLPAR